MNRHAPEPLHYQLTNYIRKLVAEELHPGDLIPSERELSEQFKMSRMTVRQAVISLVEEGILYREQGKGTYVSRLRIDKGGKWAPITSFSEDVVNRGMTPKSQVLTFCRMTSFSEVHQALQTNEVYLLKRVRFANSVPLAIESTYLPVEYFDNLERYDFETNSLYKVLKGSYGIVLSKLSQSFFVSSINQEEARCLLLESGSPALCTVRTVFETKGLPIEYTKGIYHPYNYRFTMEVKV